MDIVEGFSGSNETGNNLCDLVSNVAIKASQISSVIVTGKYFGYYYSNTSAGTARNEATCTVSLISTNDSNEKANDSKTSASSSTIQGFTLTVSPPENCDDYVIIKILGTKTNARSAGCYVESVRIMFR